jgi:hypothetical protein
MLGIIGYHKIIINAVAKISERRLRKAVECWMTHLLYHHVVTHPNWASRSLTGLGDGSHGFGGLGALLAV